MKPLALFFCCFPLFIYGQSDPAARLTALGHAAGALRDVWSIQANPAAILKAAKPVLAVQYAQYTFAASIQTQAAALLYPFKQNSLAISVLSCGIPEFRMIKSSFLYAKHFDHQLSLGLNLNHHQLNIKQYGKAQAFSVDFGAVYGLNTRFTLASYWKNIYLSRYQQEVLLSQTKSLISLDAAYQLTENVLAVSALQYQAQYMSMHMGIEYQMLELLALRGALSFNPFKQYAGVGLHYKKLNMDMSLQVQETLGNKFNLSLAYAF